MSDTKSSKSHTSTSSKSTIVSGGGAPSAGQHSGNGDIAPSTSSIIKDGWGTRSNFQASYGLKMTPEDLEEGNAILKAMQTQGR